MLTSQDEIQLSLLRILQDQPDLSQRNLAKDMGVSLGSIKYCFKALVAKGRIKLESFSASKHKHVYMYLLTLAGAPLKSKSTASFHRIKLLEFDVLEKEIEMLQSEADMS